MTVTPAGMQTSSLGPGSVPPLQLAGSCQKPSPAIQFFVPAQVSGSMTTDASKGPVLVTVVASLEEVLDAAGESSEITMSETIGSKGRCGKWDRFISTSFFQCEIKISFLPRWYLIGYNYLK